jgi:hypothetical protein
MKKNKKIILLIILGLLISVGIYFEFFYRTPEKLLKEAFNVDLSDFDYEIEIFEDEWFFNGNGHTKIVIKFNELTQENIKYFKNFDVKSYENIISETGFSIRQENYGVYKSFDVDYKNKVAILDWYAM